MIQAHPRFFIQSMGHEWTSGVSWSAKADHPRVFVLLLRRMVSAMIAEWRAAGFTS
ncbi:MAG: hypothetical protein ACI9MJ_002436 [Alphaproteobacteria bacterium]|jgi:hypothetical protein